MQALPLRLAGRRCGPKAADDDCVNIGKVAQVFAWGTDQSLVPQIGCGSGQNGRHMEQEASLGRALRKRTRSRRRNRPFDQGFSLVEIIMTISIMSIILVPALDAVVATIRAGTSANSFSDTNLVLQNAADRVNRAPKSCDYTQYAQAAAQTNGWAAATTSVVQQHYVPGVKATDPGRWDDFACVVGGSTPPDLAVQLVTISVSSPHGRFHKTLQVVKSDV